MDLIDLFIMSNQVWVGAADSGSASTLENWNWLLRIYFCAFCGKIFFYQQRRLLRKF
jgi:hypothetical protein